MTEITKLAVDAYKNKISGNYSTSDAMETLRLALVEANNGSTKLDYKAVRDGKCSKLFAIVEEILTKTIVEGLPESSPIFGFVEMKNEALGDTPEFYIPDNSLLAVSDIAAGTQGVRRQRIVDGTTVTVSTQLKAIKIYEELDRVLSGCIDFNEFINRVGKSFTTQINNDIVTAFLGIYSKVVAPYQQTGSWVEATLLALIDHVEAATGMTAKIFGSRTAVRKIATTVTGNEVNSDFYNMGYTGSFNGTPVFALKNGHKVGTTDFILSDTDVYVVAGDDKFIKFVTEGDTTILYGNPMDNADLSQEFMVAHKYGTAIALSQAFGVYRIS